MLQQGQQAANSGYVEAPPWVVVVAWGVMAVVVAVGGIGGDGGVGVFFFIVPGGGGWGV